MNFNSLKQSINKRNINNFYKINFKTSYNKNFHKKSFDNQFSNNNLNNNENSFLEEITDILNDVSNNSESKSNKNIFNEENNNSYEKSFKKDENDDNNKIADPRINFELINNINRSRPQTSYGGLKQRKKNLQSALQTSKYKTKNNFYINDY